MMFWVLGLSVGLYDKNPIYRVVENKSKVVIFARVSIFKFIGLPVYKSQVTQVTKH